MDTKRRQFTGMGLMDTEAAAGERAWVETPALRSMASAVKLQSSHQS